MQYNKLLFRTILRDDNMDARNRFKELRKECNELILAIPDRWIYARIFGDDNGYDPEYIRNLWLDFKFIDEVIILDRDHMTLKSMAELANFDSVFYGAENGKYFEADKKFAAEKGINLISTLPERFIDYSDHNALELALKDVPQTKKIVLFGTGAYFDIYMKRFAEKYAPSYAVDNNEEKWGTIKNGVSIENPQKLFEENPDDVLVILCAKNYSGQRDQLLSFGDFNYRPLIFNNEFALLEEFFAAAENEKAYMERASVVLDKLMREFDRICQKYNLKYYVISGSLIGVVRHHGMIPWDDDIDVGMPRADLNKLKEIAAKEWDGKEFLFLDYKDLGNDTFLDLMPRLYYTGEKFPTKIMDKARGKMTADVADTLILDVYPIDNASDNPKKHARNMFKIKAYYNLLMGHRANMDYAEYGRLPEWKVNLMKFVHSVGAKMNYQKLVNEIEKVIQCENGKETENYFMSSGPIYFVERTYKREFFEEGQRMPFNDFEVTVPKDYDGLLHAEMYGNYMEYPPFRVRKPSHYFNADISIW